jgi:hypothetical protein
MARLRKSPAGKPPYDSLIKKIAASLPGEQGAHALRLLSQSPRVRAKGIRGLRGLPREKAVPLLLKLLQDKNPKVRAEARRVFSGHLRPQHLADRFESGMRR